MSARPYRSGHCNLSNPPESHATCTGTTVNRGQTLECSCVCHLNPSPAPAVGAAMPIPPAAPSSAGNTGVGYGHDAGEVHLHPKDYIGVPGFHPDIPEADYHADPSSLSHSGAKTLLKAPALFKWEQDHPAPFKKHFEYGTAAHGKVLGVGQEIRVIPADILASNGAVSTSEAKAFVAQARADGAIPLKADEAQQIDDMADQLANHTLAMELLSEGQPEISAYAIDEETGVLRRCRYDWIGPDFAADYKSAESADPREFRRKAASFGYHQQHPFYSDIARDLGRPLDLFVFIVQMKTAPYLVSFVELIPQAVERGRELNRRALQLYRDCITTDEWPGYVPDTEFARIDLPAWAYSDTEVEITE